MDNNLDVIYLELDENQKTGLSPVQTLNKRLQEQKNTIQSKSIDTEKKQEQQRQRLYLHIILLFDSKIPSYKIDDDSTINSLNQIFKEGSYHLDIDSKSIDGIVKERYYCIPEIIEEKNVEKLNKQIQRYSSQIKKDIFDIANSYSKNDKINLTFHLICDYDEAVMPNYISTIFIKNIFCDEQNSIKDIINLRNSYIRKHYPKSTQSGDNAENTEETIEPTDNDVKISAILCHYAYFYLDWLEYVEFKYKTPGKYKKQSTDIKEEFKQLYRSTTEKTEDMWSLPNKEKIQLRIINRLKEISQIVGLNRKEISITNEIRVNNIYNDLYNTERYRKIIKNKEIDKKIENIAKKYKFNDKNYSYFSDLKIIHEKIDEDEELVKNCIKKLIAKIDSITIFEDILRTCKREGRPIGLYNLYNKLGYWEYLNNPNLEAEAQYWYVSHPRIVYASYTNDSVVNTKDNDKLFILKQDSDTSENLVFNTILKQKYKNLSGYAGLLFVKVKNNNVRKFMYCTKGTDVNSINDWLCADLLQGLTGFSLQHIQNVETAICIENALNDTPDLKFVPLIFCGHSLGGGLASACAISSQGRHAITFNAAGLNFIGSIYTRIRGVKNNKLSFLRPIEPSKRIHPIRIDGEAVDLLMLISKFILLGLNERGYGYAPLIIKFKGNQFMYDMSETGNKHGINNFLYKEIIDSLYLNTKRTVMKSKKNNDICNIQLDSLGLNYITFESQNKTLIQDFLDAININTSLYPFANYNINDKKIDYFNK